MVEVTLHDTPSEAIIKTAKLSTDVKDATGRTITIRKMDVLDRLHLFEVVGAVNVTNPYYFGYATLAYQTAAIDGDPVPRPRTKPQLEALIQRLGDEGMNAIAASLNADAEDAGETDRVDAIKNG